MATTRSRPRGRETARPNSGGVAAEHKTKIWGVAIGGIAVIVAFLALTGIGHVIDLAVQHFMLFYAGVFALIGLCASVGAGLVATDRMVLHAGHRVWVQSAHRAISFGALAFLVVHIVTEILAQRIHAIDAVVPFLSPFRTFYIGLGTIASDLVILLVITGILRKRFTSNSKSVWRWRAIHYTSYVAFVFGVWHGLLGGRPGKPYVDWSYGFVVALVALGVAVRILANALRPKENLSAPPVPESGGFGSAQVRAAAMVAQNGAVRAAAEAGMTTPDGMPHMLPATGAASRPVRVIPALPAGSGYSGPTVQEAPVYEPGYDGPPRYRGAPRPVSGPNPVVPSSTISGPLPQVEGRPSGGFRRPASGPMPQAPGVMREAMSGAHPRPRTGPVPRMPGAGSGGFPRPATESAPRALGPPSGGFARPATGPMPRAAGAQAQPTLPGSITGAFARPASGPMPQVTGAMSGPQGRPERTAGYDAARYDPDGYDPVGYDGAPHWQTDVRDTWQEFRGGDGRR